MKFVRLVYPENGAEYNAPEAAVGDYLGRGWQLADANLTARTKDELQALAKERGVSVSATVKKADLVEAVSAADDKPASR